MWKMRRTSCSDPSRRRGRKERLPNHQWMKRSRQVEDAEERRATWIQTTQPPQLQQPQQLPPLPHIHPSPPTNSLLPWWADTTHSPMTLIQQATTAARHLRSAVMSLVATGRGGEGQIVAVITATSVTTTSTPTTTTRTVTTRDRSTTWGALKDTQKGSSVSFTELLYTIIPLIPLSLLSPFFSLSPSSPSRQSLSVRPYPPPSPSPSFSLLEFFSLTTILDGPCTAYYTTNILKNKCTAIT